MALIEINHQPSRRELQWFGLLFLLFWGIIGGLLWWKFALPTAATVVWVAAAAVTVVYYAVPAVRRWVYLGWLYAAFPIGWVVSHVIMAVVYYGIVTPIGLALRLAGHDPMRRKLEPEAESYWVPHKPTKDKRRYFRQFY